MKEQAARHPFMSVDWDQDIQDLGSDLLVSLYRRMLLIRRTEEKIAERYPEQNMRCPVHLSIGQEASAAGVCALLTDQDVVYSTHRCHGHYLAKSGDLKRMIAELYGKKTGCAHGKGGSMHLIDMSVGMMGTSAIVGSTIPIATGHGLAFKKKALPHIAVAFFGDAAVEQGTFHESLNFASLHKLPVLFICENNGYATYTPISERQTEVKIFEKAKGHGMPGVQVDGDNVLAVYKAVAEAVKKARRQEGPSLIECLVHRWKDHVGPNHDWEVGFRNRADVEAGMALCPIKQAEMYLITKKILTQGQCRTIQEAIDAELKEAFLFAEESPFPSIDEGGEGLFV